MKKFLPIGMVLIALGVLCLLFSTVQFKRSEEVFRVGSFSARSTTSRTVPAFRYVGIGCAAAGVVLVVLGWLRKV